MSPENKRALFSPANRLLRASVFIHVAPLTQKWASENIATVIDTVRYIGEAAILLYETGWNRERVTRGRYKNEYRGKKRRAARSHHFYDGEI